MSVTNQRQRWMLAASVSLLAACAVSPEYDKQAGQQAAKQIEQQIPMYDDAALSQYVQRVGARLVSQLGETPFDFQFEVLDDPVPNAFALPGGYIYISRGLLALMASEDELACVLAHEIIHVTQRHSVKQMKSSVLPSLATVPGHLVGVVSSDLGQLINAPINTGNSLLLAGYSRSHETEADKLGIELAAQAGYQPLAMGRILLRMNRAIEFVTDTEREKSYFDSHPFTPERATTADRHAQTLQSAELDAIAPQFVRTLDGLVMGDNPKQGVFVEQQFLQPELDLTLTFPSEWQTVNQASMVGAIKPDQSAFVVMQGVSNDFSAKEHALRYQAQIEARYGVRRPIIEHSNQGGETLYQVSLVDERSQPARELSQWWFRQGAHTYQAVSMATMDDAALTQATLLSVRPLTEAERMALRYHALTIVEGKEGETLTDVHQRTGSTLSVKGLTVLNEQPDNLPLTQGQLLKVIEDKPYVSVGNSPTP